MDNQSKIIFKLGKWDKIDKPFCISFDKGSGAPFFFLSLNDTISTNEANKIVEILNKNIVDFGFSGVPRDTELHYDSIIKKLTD